MFNRELRKSEPKKRRLPPDILKARNHLAEFGWSYRAAASACGVAYQWLSDVLNRREHRSSRRLIKKINALPKRADWEQAEQTRRQHEQGLSA